VLDEAGRSRHVFRSGEPLRLAIRVVARTPRESAAVAVEVRDGDGRVLFRTATNAALHDGAARLTFDVARLALLGGDYDLVVGDRVVPLSVAADPDAEGVVDLRGTWRAASAAEVAP
jgi:Wzt C-terminal domain